MYLMPHISLWQHRIWLFLYVHKIVQTLLIKATTSQFCTSAYSEHAVDGIMYYVTLYALHLAYCQCSSIL